MAQRGATRALLALLAPIGSLLAPIGFVKTPAVVNVHVESDWFQKLVHVPTSISKDLNVDGSEHQRSHRCIDPIGKPIGNPTGNPIANNNNNHLYKKCITECMKKFQFVQELELWYWCG